MGIKIEKILLVLFLVLFSANLPTLAAEVGDIVRVGITDNKFQNVLRQEVKL